MDRAFRGWIDQRKSDPRDAHGFSVLGVYKGEKLFFFMTQQRKNLRDPDVFNCKKMVTEDTPFCLRGE